MQPVPPLPRRHDASTVRDVVYSQTIADRSSWHGPGEVSCYEHEHLRQSGRGCKHTQNAIALLVRFPDLSGEHHAGHDEHLACGQRVGDAHVSEGGRAVRGRESAVYEDMDESADPLGVMIAAWQVHAGRERRAPDRGCGGSLNPNDRCR